MKMSELYTFMNEHGGADTFMNYYEVSSACEDIEFGAEDRELDAEDMEHYIQDGEPSPEQEEKEEDENMELVKVENQQIVTDSRQIAENFGKEHKHVLDAIRNILVAENSATKIFMKSEHEYRGQKFPMYLMNRDGFSLLAMGFTGKKALEWKLKYIKAFNDMEAELKAKQEPKSQIDLLVESAKALQRQERELARIKMTQEEHAKSLKIVNSRIDTFNCVCTKGTKRQKLVAMINAYSNKHGLTYREGWHRFKQAYNLAFHTSLGNSISFYVKENGLKRKPSVPDFLERKELLDDAMRVADKLLNAGGVCVG